MDRKKALDIVNEMIAEQSSSQLKGAIDDYIKEVRKPEALQKMSAPAMPKAKAPEPTSVKMSAPMAKIDPNTRLPGTLLDKNGMMSGGNTMGASLGTMTPAAAGSVDKAAPDEAPPMQMSEMKKGLAAKMQKCMGAMKKGSAVNLSMKEQVAKDDMPHAPNSPEDKAHDIVESGESMKGAMKVLHNDPAKVKKMLSHLRSRKDDGKAWERSPENRAAGEVEKKEEDKAKEMSGDAAKAIEASADKPMKIAEARPGQANESKEDKKI